MDSVASSTGAPALGAKEVTVLRHLIDPHLLPATLVVVTSAAFLIPAGVSWRASRYWHAWLFTSMSMICAVYHFCDTDMPLLLGANETCGDSVLHMLTLLDHGWAYFSVFQVGLIVLGPEDPYLQWMDMDPSENPSYVTLARWPSTDVLMYARILPAIAMCIFLACYNSWADFHWHCMLLCVLMSVICCIMFWSSMSRRHRAVEVLLRQQYWTRLYRLCCVPLTASALFFIAMEGLHSLVLHALWHIVVASFAVSVLHDVAVHGARPANRVFDTSARNPFVAHYLLLGVVVCALPTILLSFAVDWLMSPTGWRWPTLSMVGMRRPGCHILTIGCIPTLLAHACTYWLVSSTLMYPYRQKGDTPSWAQWWASQLAETKIDKSWPSLGSEKWPFFWGWLRDPASWAYFNKQSGCTVGYMSALLGVVVLAVQELQIFSHLHMLVNALCFCATVSAVLLTTISSTSFKVPGVRLRWVLAAALVVLSMALLVLLVLDTWSTPGAESVTHTAYSCTEYIVLILLSAWPLTWKVEVEDAWIQRTAERFEWPSTSFRFNEGL